MNFTVPENIEHVQQHLKLCNLASCLYFVVYFKVVFTVTLKWGLVSFFLNGKDSYLSYTSILQYMYIYCYWPALLPVTVAMNLLWIKNEFLNSIFCYSLLYYISTELLPTMNADQVRSLKYCCISSVTDLIFFRFDQYNIETLYMHYHKYDPLLKMRLLKS